MASFGFGLAAEIQFLNFLAFETGAELAQDWVIIFPDDEAEYRGHMLEIPALLKLVLKPAGAAYHHQRYVMKLAVGYKIGFFPVEKKRVPRTACNPPPSQKNSGSRRR